MFGRDNVYVELQNAHLDVQARILPQLAELAADGRARRPSRPATSTTSAHEDARAHEALLCIQSGDSLKNPNHWKFDTDHFYFKTPEEMAGDFPGHDDALRRTLEVAERCNVEIELGQILLPKFPVPGRPRRVRLPRRALREGPAKALRRRSTHELHRAAPLRAEDDQARWASPTTS